MGMVRQYEMRGGHIWRTFQCLEDISNCFPVPIYHYSLGKLPPRRFHLRFDAGCGKVLPRVHYLDEGPREGKVVLCLHGEPAWSFLYR